MVLFNFLCFACVGFLNGAVDSDAEFDLDAELSTELIDVYIYLNTSNN